MNTDEHRSAEPQTQRSSLGAHASSVPRVSDTGTQDACAPRSPRRKSVWKGFFCSSAFIRVHRWFLFLQFATQRREFLKAALTGASPMLLLGKSNGYSHAEVATRIREKGMTEGVSK